MSLVNVTRVTFSPRPAPKISICYISYGMNKEQQIIHEWMAAHGWSYWTPHEMLARITEEVGELARVVNHEYGPKQRKTSEDGQELEEELGDILYALACFANAHQINLDTALQKSHQKVITRDITRFT